MTKHWVLLMQHFNSLMNLVIVDIHSLGIGLHVFICLRNKFMQWRIQQSNRYRQTNHHFKQLFKVTASYDEASHTYACDTAKTDALRSAERASRLQKAVPVSEWMSQQKERMTQQPLALEVREMYNDCFGNSPTWHQEFTEFWDLPEEFRF